MNPLFTFHLTLLIFLVNCGLVKTLILHDSHKDGPVKVLVFGDSFGALGPGYWMLRDMFARHGVESIVESTAVTGTTACQWAKYPSNLAAAAKRKFPETGPDFVWLTLGGNDLLGWKYLACSQQAKDFASGLLCAYTQAERARNCNAKLLKSLYAQFPNVRVLQCSYDLECDSALCRPYSRWPFCGSNTSCANHMGISWGKELIRPLEDVFIGRYTAISVVGTVQLAGKVPGATPGHPNLDVGSPCELMEGCEHPLRESIAAYFIGEVFWTKYFKGKVSGQVLPRVGPPEFKPSPLWKYQNHSEVDDVRCNKRWVPNLEDENNPPPPCNRTPFDHLR